MKITTKLFLGILAGTLLFTACKKEDQEETTDDVNLSQIVQAHGGETAISTINYVNYKATGLAFEFQEAPEPQNNLVTNYTFDLTASLDADEIKQDWSMSVIYPFDFSLSFIDIIAGNTGVVNGGPNTFGAYAFGAFGQPNDPMVSIKLASRKKTFFMSSPLAVLKQLITEGATVTGNSLSTSYQGQTITVLIDPVTKLINSVSTKEFDPLHGDVVYEVLFSNWTTIGDIKYPEKIEHKLKDEIIRIEDLTSIELNVSVAGSTFDFGASTPVPFDATQAAKGYLSSQYYFRMFMIGFPFDVFDEQVTIASFTDANNDVLVIEGTAHYSYAFKVNNEIILYDASQNNERQLAVLTAVNQNFPGLPIKAVVLSHNHLDHAGGLRGALSSGGDLIVGQSSVTEWGNILNRPYTLQNNPLTNSVNIIGVSNMITYGSGSELIEIYTAQTSHTESEDMLLIYKPSTKTIFFADLYNGGFVNIMGFFPNLATTIKSRAQQLVNFVNAKGLSVQLIGPTHGDLSDNSYQSVITAAQ